MTSIGEDLLVILSCIIYKRIPATTCLPWTRVLLLLLILNLLMTISLLVKADSSLNIDNTIIDIVTVYEIVNSKNVVIRIIQAVLPMYLTVYYRRSIWIIFVVGLVYYWFLLDRVERTILASHLLLIDDRICVKSLSCLLIDQTQLLLCSFVMRMRILSLI